MAHLQTKALPERLQQRSLALEITLIQKKKAKRKSDPLSTSLLPLHIYDLGPFTFTDTTSVHLDNQHQVHSDLHQWMNQTRTQKMVLQPSTMEIDILSKANT